MMDFTARLICLSALAAGIASAASYKIMIRSNSTVGATELKAGLYTVEMKGDKTLFKSEGKTIAVPAALEKSPVRFADTMYVSKDSTIMEIDLGNTSEKIVFGGASTAATGTK